LTTKFVQVPCSFCPMFSIFFCVFSVWFILLAWKKNQAKKRKAKKKLPLWHYANIFFFFFFEKVFPHGYCLCSLTIGNNVLAIKALFRFWNKFHFFFWCHFGTNYSLKKKLLSKFNVHSFYHKSFFFQTFSKVFAFEHFSEPTKKNWVQMFFSFSCNSTNVNFCAQSAPNGALSDGLVTFPADKCPFFHIFPPIMFFRPYFGIWRHLLC